MDFSAAVLLKAFIMKTQHTKKPAKPRKDEASHKDETSPKKQTSKGRDKHAQKQDAPKGLTREDLPDATNESTGAMGSGQRQDSN
jgi:hypothetical protein